MGAPEDSSDTMCAVRSSPPNPNLLLFLLIFAGTMLLCTLVGHAISVSYSLIPGLPASLVSGYLIGLGAKGLFESLSRRR